MVCKHSVIKGAMLWIHPRARGSAVDNLVSLPLSVVWPKADTPGTGKEKVGGGVELLTFTLFPYNEKDGFTHWCNPSWSHMMFSEIHRRGDFPKNANKMSQKFTQTFWMTSASVLNHPAYLKLEGLDLSGWHVPSCHGGESTGAHLAL